MNISASQNKRICKKIDFLSKFRFLHLQNAPWQKEDKELNRLSYISLLKIEDNIDALMRSLEEHEPRLLRYIKEHDDYLLEQTYNIEVEELLNQNDKEDRRIFDRGI